MLEVRNLTLGYDKKEIIKDLSFSVKVHDFLLVLGRNGAGKSTLIKGILKYIEPISGEIKFNILKNEIGYMPQESQVERTFPASVSEVILSGYISKLGKGFFYKKSAKDELKKVAKILKIEGLLKKTFGELSGGERQKVLLARAIISSPKLLILDEPSNNLDDVSRRELYLELKHLNEGHGITIIMITHDINYDSLIGNKILCLDTPYFYGSTEEYMEEIKNDIE